MSNHFLIGVYGYKDCSPIHLDPYSLAKVKQARSWQGVGNYNNRTTFHICTPHPTARGTFVSVETGAEFPANRGGWTEEAWSAFLERTWPAKEEG